MKKQQRYFFCFPQGGFNDFCQIIWNCLEYCINFNRIHYFVIYYYTKIYFYFIFFRSSLKKYYTIKSSNIV